MQEIDKQESTAALVTIGEGMIFHNEIQQVCRFAFYRWVRFFTKYTLFKIAENSGQPILMSWVGKKSGGFPSFYQLLL